MIRSEINASLFWAKVDRNGPDPSYAPGLGNCWVWVAGKKAKGYGNFWVAGKCEAAHRVSFVLDGGHIPDGKLVLHHCDNPPCVRPSHLYVGSDHDNAMDRSIRKRHGLWRHPERAAGGSRNGSAKLTEDQIKEIRRLYATGEWKQSEIAEAYGVIQQNVSMIVRGRTWTVLDA